MKSVNIEREKLLGIVLENKTKHVAEYNEAVADFIAAVKLVAKQNLEAADTITIDNADTVLKSFPHSPTSYESNYTKAIRMLELSTDEIINVDETTFNQLVLDEWSWKHSFVTSNSTLKTYY